MKKMVKEKKLPKELEELLIAYRDKKSPVYERGRPVSERCDELADMLEEVESVRALVTSPPYNFSPADHARLKKMLAKKKPEAVVRKPEKVLVRAESKDYRDFLVAAWKDVKEVGMTTVMKWYNRGSEFGYFDEEKGKVDILRFVEDALNFYVRVAPHVEEIEQENVASAAMLRIMTTLYRRAMHTLTTLKITLDQIEAMNPEIGEVLIPLKVQLPEVS